MRGAFGISCAVCGNRLEWDDKIKETKGGKVVFKCRKCETMLRIDNGSLYKFDLDVDEPVEEPAVEKHVEKEEEDKKDKGDFVQFSVRMLKSQRTLVRVGLAAMRRIRLLEEKRGWVGKSFEYIVMQFLAGVPKDILENAFAEVEQHESLEDGAAINYFVERANDLAMEGEVLTSSSNNE